MKTYITNKPFLLENGETIQNLEISYHTFGKLNNEKNNVVWLCHALTANSDAQDWWPGIVGEGKLFDPNEHFIVCANILGSAYGTTGPLSILLNQSPLLDKFPSVSIRDMVNAHILLRKHLEIQSIHTLIGPSVGGQQALEWSIQEPYIFQYLILIATNTCHSAYGIAFNESQRLAIFADSSYGNGNKNGGRNGLIAARSIALLGYRSYDGYNKNQKEQGNERTSDYLASSYQRYQGEKLANRFNAYSYVLLSKAMDSHNIGRGKKSIDDALLQVKAKTLVIGVDSDVLFPVQEQKIIANGIPDARFEQISSDFGHDGFLLENDQLTTIISDFYSNKKSQSFSNRFNFIFN